jgi:hypothetical protein
VADNPYPEAFLIKLRQIKGRRARIVVEHILTHGFITTEELETLYGYSHPPRAIRDVREQGIPLETFTVKSSTGRSIAAYRFGEVNLPASPQFAGRTAPSKQVKKELLVKQHSRCAVCQIQLDERYLQMDHRIPYLVAGEGDIAKDELDAYMLVCASCNRSKSWTCEHCDNGVTVKDASVCLTCYWASPGAYIHIALVPIRRLDLVWQDEEVEVYERLAKRARQESKLLQDIIKQILERQVDEDTT